MKLASVQAIVRALEAAGVRYLVVGGLAVNAYGIHRFTKDLDLVIELTSDNVHAAFAALEDLAYRPSVPVAAEQLGDERTREALVRDKGLQVLQLWSDAHRETPVDLFVNEPFPFLEEYERSPVRELAGAGTVRIVSLPTLIRMKEAAARPQDLLDAEELRHRLEEDA